MRRKIKQAFAWVFRDDVFGLWMVIGGALILALPPYTWFSNLCGAVSLACGIPFMVAGRRKRKIK